MTCAHCHLPGDAGNPLVEYGGRRSGPMMLHRVCWAQRATDQAELVRAVLEGRR